MERRTEVVASAECAAHLRACPLEQYGAYQNNGQYDLCIREEGLHWL